MKRTDDGDIILTQGQFDRLMEFTWRWFELNDTDVPDDILEMDETLQDEPSPLDLIVRSSAAGII